MEEKLFREIEVGQHYEWINYQGEKHVLRVKNKRLTLGNTPSVEVSGLFFFLKDEVPRGQGIPAGAKEWNRVDDTFRLWTGATPRCTPVHKEYYCENCDHRTDEGMFSSCCKDSMYIRRIFKGEHDSTCLCEDCYKEE